jgi:hypothetical protein
MTLVRRLVLGISSRVVRWASPGCKEWAEGLEREAAVIESDWAALHWAIGSMRVLLDRRAVPLNSLDEVPAETQKLVEKIRMRAGFVLAMSIMYGLQALFLYLWKFCNARSTFKFAGCALVVLGSILVGAYALIDRRRSNVPWYDDIYDDPVACTHLYKEQLKRGDSLWIYASYLLYAGLGPLTYYHGESYDSVDMICSGILVGLFLLFIPLVILQVRRNKLRRIEEIDALLAEREHGAEL